MRPKTFQRKTVIALLIVFLSGLVWVGCSALRGEKQAEEGVTTTKYGAKYYHFDDVLIPGELKYKPKKSTIYETPKFKMGRMVFSKWRVDVESLIDFFTHHMERDNWKLLNTYRGKESILNFSKPDKTCTIKITETWYGKAEVEVRLGLLSEKRM